MGGLAGLVVNSGSALLSSSGPPWSTVADMVTAEPANNAPRVRTINFHEPGDADKWATIARSTLRFTVCSWVHQNHHVLQARLYRALL